MLEAAAYRLTHRGDVLVFNPIDSGIAIQSKKITNLIQLRM